MAWTFTLNFENGLATLKLTQNEWFTGLYDDTWFYIFTSCRFFSKSLSDISRQSDVRSGKCQCQTETDYLRYSMNMTSWWFGCFQLSPVSIVYNQYFLESLSLPNKSIQGATKKIHNFIPQKSLCPALTSQSMIDGQKRVGQKRTVLGKKTTLVESRRYP